MGANHLGSVMHSELKEPARVMLFPLVGICYNISLLIKEMASHLPCFKENMRATAELKRATTSNSSLQMVQKHEGQLFIRFRQNPDSKGQEHLTPSLFSVVTIKWI